MSVLIYVTDDARDDLSLFDDEVEDTPEDNRKGQPGVKVRPAWAVWYDRYFGKLEGESDNDDSDALLCESLDETNYISADHGYYPDISRWQPDPESSDEEITRSESYKAYAKSLRGFGERVRLDILNGD
jgi:hypothetical protein